jgi:hypothetical protein
VEVMMHQFQTVLEEAGYLCRSYSGRGMYGQTCLAVDPGPSIGAFMADVVAFLASSVDNQMMDDLDENRETVFSVTEDAFRSMARDQMGLGTVLYFPGVPYTEEEENEPA